jgi:hypothetical protein
MSRLARKRHLRYSQFDRTGRSKNLRAFLAERAEELEGTGASTAFTVTEPGEPLEPAVAAEGTLEAVTIEADDTVTIGETEYTFVTELTTDPAAVPYEVLVGGDLGESIDNLVAAINGDDGEGTTYGTGTEAHPDVTAENVADELVVTAKVAGDAGNAIATTAVLTSGDWAAATLAGGSDEVPAVPASNELTSEAHGLSVGAGPFLVTTTDEVPDGLSESQFYWIHDVPDDDTLILCTRRGGGAISPITSAGAGTLALVKADSAPAIMEYLKTNAPEVVRDAEDVDDL